MKKMYVLLILLIMVIGVISLKSTLGQAEPNSCMAKLDVMIAMDRSASMNYTSRCDWWKFVCINPPSCSSGYSWVKNTTYNQTQAWCNTKNQTAPHQSVWTDYGPNKMTAANLAADNFLGLLGTDDQSGLTSFANDVTLNKILSNNHEITKTALDNLVSSGGGTNIGDAINFSNQELQSARAGVSAGKVIILLTDGTANKPSGNGTGENPADVAYAIAKAGEAATAGIKIFTIGLGNDINQTMLQTIASTTGGQYYFAPTAENLNDIFNLIKTKTCEQESVCGDGIKNGSEQCDGTDGVGANQSCSDTCTLIDPPAILSYRLNGLAANAELVLDSPTSTPVSISITASKPVYWYRVWICRKDGDSTCGDTPGSNSSTVQYFYRSVPPYIQDYTTDNGQWDGKDYQGVPVPDGEYIIRVYIADELEQETRPFLTPYTIRVKRSCGDGIKYGMEQCDGTDGVGAHQYCSAYCALWNLPYCGDGIINNENTEQCDDGNTVDGDGCSAICAIENSECKTCGNLKVVDGNGDEIGYFIDVSIPAQLNEMAFGVWIPEYKQKFMIRVDGRIWRTPSIDQVYYEQDNCSGDMYSGNPGAYYFSLGTNYLPVYIKYDNSTYKRAKLLYTKQNVQMRSYKNLLSGSCNSLSSTHEFGAFFEIEDIADFVGPLEVRAQ